MHYLIWKFQNKLYRKNVCNQLQKIPELKYDVSIMTTMPIIVHLTTHSTLSLLLCVRSVPLANA